MGPGDLRYDSYVKALATAFQIAKDGGTAVIELFNDDSGKLEPTTIDQAGAISALQAIISDAACLALDNGLLSPDELAPLAATIGKSRPADIKLH